MAAVNLVSLTTKLANLVGSPAGVLHSVNSSVDSQARFLLRIPLVGRHLPPEGLGQKLIASVLQDWMSPPKVKERLPPLNVQGVVALQRTRKPPYTAHMWLCRVWALVQQRTISV